MTKRFVAVDGESAADGDGREHYFLLASSAGPVARNARGLSTARCLDFLLQLSAADPHAALVAFGLDYDVNMWLHDLPTVALRRLVRTGETAAIVKGRGYWLQWIPGKSFAVTDYYRGGSAKVCDAFGFFQSSFVDALSEWELSDELHAIARMKDRRGAFDLADADEIETYCRAECRLLAELMARVAGALKTAGVPAPRSWIGAGPVADALMRAHGVQAHHAADPTSPAKLARAVGRAYFGGRVELFQMGLFGEAWHYDLNSAYPAAALELPTLAGGRWVKTERYDPEAPWALWRVRWELPPDSPLAPFPYRQGGEVYYPTSGEGWYWSPEVTAALAAFPGRLKVKAGWRFLPGDDARPFGFVERLYGERQRFAAAGDPAQKVLKLGMNALYGKLAQGVGARGRLPAYRSLVWAGLITSATRARVLSLAAHDPEAMVAISTDGLMATRELPDVATGDGLGAWSAAPWRDLFVAGNGIYHGYTLDGEEVRRARGFLSRDLDYRAIRAGWRRLGPFYRHHFTQRRFVGARSALRSRDGLADWRSWRDEPRELAFDPRPRKWFADEPLSWQRGRLTVRLVPPIVAAGAVSEPYKLKDSPAGVFSTVPSDPADDYAAGREQPLKVL